ncbi:MAG: ATPase, T2SS/T4P/T4SS family, partial [Gammaproteobacteria bacterium]
MFDVLVNNSKGERIQNFNCPVSECTIGKARDNFIQLRGWKVAPYHAVISRTSEGLFIEDKTKQSRIEVNGEDVEHHGPIRTSDKIIIAGYHIQAGISADSADEIDPDDDDAFEDMKTVIGIQQHEVLTENEELSNTIINLQHDEKFKWRNRVHEELLAAMDLRRTDISSMDEDTLRKHVEKMIKEIIADMEAKLPSDVHKEQLASEVLNEAVGLGPLEKLLADDTVTEIMVNKFDEIFIEQSGKLTLSDITFSSDDAVMTAIERIVSPLGRRIDESSPLVDARLKDGSRVNAIIPPLALRGPCLTIRKFAKQKLQAHDLVNFGALNDKMVKFLETAVQNHMNILISGGTGSGKTTLLNVLSNFIPPSERIITVEDAAELKLVQPHLVSLEARPANLEGKGAIP